MKRLLHIIATPRGAQSRTLQVSKAFVKRFANENPGTEVDILDLGKESLPPLTLQRVKGKYSLMSGKEMTEETRGHWKAVEEHIERFKRADVVVVSSPMWNFSIPYALKHYIDLIVQPGYTVRFTEDGPEGLLRGKRMFVATSRGGDYGSESMKPLDFQEPYLRAVFGFIGITDIDFVHAQPMDMGGTEQGEARLREAVRKAGSLASGRQTAGNRR